MSPCPIADKYRAFNWNVIEINAHSLVEIEAAYTAARECKGKPTMIVASSIKGKGVSYMENNAAWHGSAPNKEQYEQAVNELGGCL